MYRKKVFKSESTPSSGDKLGKEIGGEEEVEHRPAGGGGKAQLHVPGVDGPAAGEDRPDGVHGDGLRKEQGHRVEPPGNGGDRPENAAHEDGRQEAAHGDDRPAHLVGAYGAN